jgi:hypothetical protein
MDGLRPPRVRPLLADRSDDPAELDQTAPTYLVSFGDDESYLEVGPAEIYLDEAAEVGRVVSGEDVALDA